MNSLMRMMILMVLAGATLSRGATFSVTSNFNSGAGSLRQALLDANASPGADLITFAISPGGTQTITLTSALPAVTEQLTVDGNTQTSFTGAPLIVLNGGGRDFPGLVITADGCVVRGLVIRSFGKTSSATQQGDGIRISGPGGNVIENCWFGVDSTGTAAFANLGDNVVILNSPNNIIGGTTPDRACIISGAREINLGGNFVGGYGVRIQGAAATGNQVLMCRIGTNAAGTASLGNDTAGILIDDAGGNFIGAAGSGNLISGHTFSTGLRVLGTQTGNVVRSNLIGLNSTGTAKLGNNTGIDIRAPGVTIGGGTASQGNVISGNGNTGITLYGPNAHDIQILTNLIGPDPTGLIDLGNGSDGIFISDDTTAVGLDGPRSNLIQGNVISGNGNTNGSTADGIAITGDVNKARAETTGATTIRGNYIGVDLTGSTAMGNMNNGIAILFSPDNMIGGTDAGQGNVISSNGSTGVVNTGSGINISGATSLGNVIQGNAIGTNIAHTANLGNKRSGIHLYDPFAGNPQQVIIGGRTLAAGNYVAFNVGNGLTIGGGSTYVRATAFFQNGGLGIDVIAGDNEGDHTPVVPGTLMNRPTILAARKGSLVVKTTVTGLQPNTKFSLSFSALDPVFEEPQLGEVEFTTDASGNATVSVALRDNVEAGDQIIATVHEADPEVFDQNVNPGVIAAFFDMYPSERSLPVVVQDNGVNALTNWRDLALGTTSNSGNAADAADPDHDGRSNFMEYCTQTDPVKPDLLPEDFLLDYDPLAHRLGAHISASNVAPNVSLTAQHSTDLVNWGTMADLDLTDDYQFEVEVLQPVSAGFGKLEWVAVPPP